MKKILAIVAVSAVYASCTSVTVKPLPPAIQCDSIISYSTVIAPLVINQCLGCHSGPHASGGYDFTTYAGLKPRVDDGTLQRDVFDLHTMPQPGSGYDLTDAERHEFACWIHQGGANN